MLQWAFRKYWPAGDGTDYLDVAARRCCGAMFVMAGVSGVIVTIMNLPYLREYSFSVTIGGLLAAVTLVVPLFFGTGSAFQRQIQVTMTLLMAGLVVLVMSSTSLLVAPTFLMIPSLMVIALILRPILAITAGICALLAVSVAYFRWHAGPEAAVNLSIDELGTICFAIVTAIVCCVAGPLIYQSQMQMATKRLATALKEAETSTKAKSGFLASVSHEIRTPMNGVLGMSEALLNGELPDEQRKLAKTIKRSGEGLLTIINEILDYSKIEAGEFTIESEPFDLTAAAKDVVNSLETQAAAKGISFDLLGDVNQPKWLLGDGVRIRQIMFNLVGNALKFTQSGGVRVSVHTAPDDGDQVAVRLEVVDTGIGIAPEKLEVIFDRFSQAESSITRRFGGTGLGLAITQHLVEAMNGKLQVQSEADKGTQFTVDFSLQKAEPSTSPEQIATQAIARKVFDGARPRVLVVDDNSINRTVVDHLLPTDQFDKSFASGGAESIEMAASSRFDLILMDISMPDVSGFAALEAIRAAEARASHELLVPVVAFSAHAHTEEVDRFAAAGFDDYLAKPVNKDRLVAMVEKWAS